MAGPAAPAGDGPMTDTPRTVVVLAFERAELLDLAGPAEVFAVTGGREGRTLFRVVIAAERPGPVSLRGGAQLLPHCTLAEAPVPDLLVVPGGPGVARQLENPALLAWLAATAPRADLVLSVCTGALLLGAAGLLAGLPVTTHHLAYDRLRAAAPGTEVREAERFVDAGRVITSGGVASGIDMALHVVERLVGPGLAAEAAHYMEYHWDRNEEGLRDQGV